MSGEVAGPFLLELEPEKLRDALRKMKSMAKEFAERGQKMRAMPGTIADSWTGKAARSTKQEMRGLGGHLENFSTSMDDSRKAVKKLATTYEQALETVTSLNTRWEAAGAAYTAAVAAADREFERRTPKPETPIHEDLVHRSAKRSARTTLETTQNSLVVEFDDLRTEVKRATQACAKDLALEVPLPVKPDEVGLYRDFRWTGLRGKRDEFTRDMPLSDELDVSDPIAPTEGQDAEDLKDKLIEDANTVLRDTALAATGGYADARITSLRERAALLRREERVVRRRAYEREGTRAGRRASRQLPEATRRVAEIDVQLDARHLKVARRVPLIGQAYGIGMDVHDVATGKEPVGKVAVKSAAGAAGGAVAVVLVANPIGLGVLGTAAVGAGGAYVLSEAASWAWDTGHIQSAGKGAAKQAKKAWKWAFG